MDRVNGMIPWSPDLETTLEVVSLLRAGQDPSATNDVHRAVQQKLAEYDVPTNADFLRYLSLIFGTEDILFQCQLVSQKSDPSDAIVRQIAGLLLKNSMRRRAEAGIGAIDEATLKYMESAVLPLLSSHRIMIRRTAGSVVATLVSIVGERTAVVWPHLLPALSRGLDNFADAPGTPGHNTVDGAFGALKKICEDAPGALDASCAGRPLNDLIPKWLAYFRHPTVSFRCAALACINSFVVIMPGALAAKTNEYLQGLSSLTQDRNSEVQKEVCTSLVSLFEVRADIMYPHLEQITSFMMAATDGQDESVALEACEFWMVFCEANPQAWSVLRNIFPRLIPLLLAKMVYSEMDLMMLVDDKEDHESVPDRPQNIVPSFHKTAIKGANGDDDDSGDDETFDDSQWNLRKCAAASLDRLATTFGAEILPHLLPHLQQSLSNAEWPIRESAILALGAVAEGCDQGLQSHMPQLYPFLIQLLEDRQPLIRSIACWTISRYVGWVAEADTGNIVPATVEALCKRVLDSSKRVQRSGCSALSILLEEIPGEGMLPYIETIVQTLISAFEKYQLNNMRVLYDSISTLAESMGAHLNHPRILELLMPPLCSTWSQITDEDPGLAPLLETFGVIAGAIGVGFAPFADAVFKRCVDIIKSGIIGILASTRMGEWIDREITVCALDAVSNVVEAMGGAAESLVRDSELIDMVIECAKDEHSEDLRQSALAVMGDVCKSCIQAFTEEQIKKLVNAIVANVRPEYVHVCNNALWCMGELVVSVGTPMAVFVPAFLECVAKVLTHEIKLERSIRENAATAMGRLAMCDVSFVARHLALFIKPWCLTVTLVQDGDEKRHAYEGLCAAIQSDPSCVLSSDFGYVVAAFVRFPASDEEGIPVDISTVFLKILRAIQGQLLRGGQWDRIYANFPPQLKRDAQVAFALGW